MTETFNFRINGVTLTCACRTEQDGDGNVYPAGFTFEIPNSNPDHPGYPVRVHAEYMWREGRWRVDVQNAEGFSEVRCSMGEAFQTAYDMAVSLTNRYNGS